MIPENDPHRSRQSLRLREYDYSTPGAYFITICLQNRRCLFGSMVSDEMHLSDAGLMVRDSWLQVPRFYPPCSTDEYVVMPNHLHAILWLGDMKPTEDGVQAQEEKTGRHRDLPLHCVCLMLWSGSSR